ncbi:MAG: hypothetical protein U0R44_06950 [Candidatus Micrarchaeia archaeon]
MIGAKTNLVSFTFREKTIAIFPKSLPLLELYRFADQVSRDSGRTLGPIGPELADMLVTSAVRTDILRSSPFATSGLIAYPPGGESIGQQVIYSDHTGVRMIFPSGAYRGEKSIALFVPRTTLSDLREDGRDIFVDVAHERIVPILRFPDESGWYSAGQDFAIPNGEPVEANKGRFLSRTKTPYVGPIARGYSFDGHGSAYVCVDFAPWYRLGAVFETDRSVPDP